MEITFSFDPNCPWTWLTSRWLVDVAAQEGHTIRWRGLSLAHLNRGREVSERMRPAMASDGQTHRLLRALLEAGDNAAIARFYDAYGDRVHRHGQAPTLDTVRAAAADAGLADHVVAALDEPRFDAAVAEATDAAVASAGGDVGSPIISFDGGPGFFGPIIDEVPADAAQRLALLRAVELLVGVPAYSELKRGRTRAPQLATS